MEFICDSSSVRMTRTRLRRVKLWATWLTAVGCEIMTERLTRDQDPPQACVGAFGALSERPQSCLPKRVRLMLAALNSGEHDMIAILIQDVESCPFTSECAIEDACRRIHQAFRPLVDEN